MRSRTVILGAAALVIMTLAAYIPAMKAGYVWDDDVHFTDKPEMKDLAGLKAMWSTSAAIYYPLVTTVWWVMRRIWGLNPLAYHLITILFHSLNAVLFWGLLRRLNVPGAWLAGAIFALHPVHVESVAWATELKNTQSGAFYLLAILSFVKFHFVYTRADESADRASNMWLWYAAAMILFVLALLSKPSTVMLPAVLLLCLWWLDGRWRRRRVALTLPFFLPALLVSAWTIWEQKYRSLAIGDEWSASFAERFALAGRIVWFYLGKLLWPQPLIFIYPRWQIDPSRFASYLPSVVVLVGLGVLWWNRRTAWGRAGLMAFAYFVILLFPVLGFFNIYFMRFSFVADHFQYLASMGIIALAAAAVWTVLIANRGRGRAYYCSFLVPTVILVVLGVLTWRQAHIYRNSETLWRDTLKKNPGTWMAHTNLGVILAHQGKTAEAKARYLRALELKDNCERTHNNLGALLASEGKLDEAIAHYRQALKARPDFPDAYRNLGQALARQGKLEEAVLQYHAALKLNPDSAGTWNDLGIALREMDRLAPAAESFRRALTLEPGYFLAAYNLANTLLKQGKPDQAKVYFDRVIELNPGHAKAHNNLGLILAAQGQLDEAERHFRRALKVEPDDLRANINLANLLFKQDQLDEALAYYEKALELDPDAAEAHFQMGRILQRRQQLGPAIMHFRTAVRLKPAWPEALNHLAWVLATHDDAKFRNPAEAVELAERACEATDDRQPAILDTLAAAYAAEGRFSDAVTMAEKGLQLALASNQVKMADEIRSRLLLYQAKRPYRQPSQGRKE